MSSPSAMPVALLYQSAAQSRHVRETLVAIGTPIAYEAVAGALDADALARSRASVVVVNLEDEDDPGLDAVYALLDDARYTVIFNDSGVSSGLSGWDHARWVRHLSAKVLGDADLDPPRPAGAEPVPARAKVPAQVAPAVAEAVVAEKPAMAIESEPVEVPPAAPPQPEFDPTEFIDLLQEAAPSDPLQGGTEKVLPTIDIDGIDGNLELSGIDDLLADFEVRAPEPMIELDSVDEFIVDIAPEDVPVAAGIRSSEPVAEPSAAMELPAGFDLDFDLDEVVGTAAPAPPPAKPAIGALADSWSLEDLTEEAAPAPVPTGPAQFGIEKVSASDYLAPEGGDEAKQPPIPSLSELSLELIPLEEAVSPTRETLDHENWFDPDSVKAKIQAVWVLGASVGGPESVREFLSEFPRDYPALFLLAQHLGDEFVDMMAKQLGRATQMTVRTPAHGERVAHGEIIIVPNSHRLQVDPMGVVLLEKNTSEAAYRPSIDRVIEDVANRYGEQAGAIVFSGMSDDAVAGCRHLVEKGGKVYAQSPESCVVSTMVDGVKEAGLVSFEGTPKELAAKLMAERT
ncbi:chemotaxis protein CheB [Dokdonella sp.]|uniref:chemotaxis protein CheB n=1 Tax=Dokdonella sp. TaxID=2291710 RepID=UPI0037848AB2